MSESERNEIQMLRVLIVDNEIGFADVLAKRLLKRGIKATKTYSGTEAIQMLRNVDFHCIVLDLKMEDMDGIEVLRIFRKMVPDLPVIVLTGHGSEETAIEGLALGAAACLIKPCGFENLVETIKTAVGK